MRTSCRREPFSPALYFNLGNAWLKAGQIGRAVRAYRQAEALRRAILTSGPIANRAQSGLSQPSRPAGTRWTRWVGRLTLNEWTVSASLVRPFFLWLDSTGNIARPEEIRRGADRCVGPAFLVLASCLGLAVNQRLLEKILRRHRAGSRGAPRSFARIQSAFTLHDGAETPRPGHRRRLVASERRRETYRLARPKRRRLDP